MMSPLAWASGATRGLPVHCPLQRFTQCLRHNKCFVNLSTLGGACMTESAIHLPSPTAATAGRKKWRLLSAISRDRPLSSAPRTAVSGNEAQGKIEINRTELVKQLRERTLVSVGLCKQALEASSWDIEEAVIRLRKADVARAAKAALREAKEGVVAVCSVNGGSSWSAVVLNCETDFVQRSAKFVAFAKALAGHCTSLPAAAKRPLDGQSCLVSHLKETQPSAELSALTATGHTAESGSVRDLLATLTSQFGEKVDISVIERLDSTNSSCIGAYVHNAFEPGVGSAAALVEISWKPLESSERAASLLERLPDLAKLLAMQVVASKPKFISLDSIPPEFVEQERAVVEHAAANRMSTRVSKPVDLSKIVEKQLSQMLKEQCLLTQEFLLMDQVHKDVLGDGVTGTDAADSSRARSSKSSTVSDALQLVGQRIGCTVEVSRMKLLTVGNR